MREPVAAGEYVSNTVQILSTVQSVPPLLVSIVRRLECSEFFNRTTHEYDAICHSEIVNEAFLQGRIGCRQVCGISDSSSSCDKSHNSLCATVFQIFDTRVYVIVSSHSERLIAVAVLLVSPQSTSQLRESVFTANECCQESTRRKSLSGEVYGLACFVAVTGSAGVHVRVTGGVSGAEHSTQQCMEVSGNDTQILLQPEDGLFL